MSTARPSRLTAVAVIATGALAGAALGVGGSLALWHDAVTVTGAIGSGYEAFAVGSPTDADRPMLPATAHEQAVSFPVTSADAARLLEQGRIAIPIRVDAVSQGNTGLRYEVVAPDWSAGGTDTVLGSSSPVVFPVAGPDLCTPDATAPADPARSSSPVSAAYDDTEATEYWCLLAVLDAPDDGTYTNTATARATFGTDTVTDTDSWTADVVTALDATGETHEVTFSWTTFRPGQETP